MEFDYGGGGRDKPNWHKNLGNLGKAKDLSGFDLNKHVDYIIPGAEMELNPARFCCWLYPVVQIFQYLTASRVLCRLYHISPDPAKKFRSSFEYLTPSNVQSDTGYRKDRYRVTPDKNGPNAAHIPGWRRHNSDPDRFRKQFYGWGGGGLWGVRMEFVAQCCESVCSCLPTAVCPYISSNPSKNPTLHMAHFGNQAANCKPPSQSRVYHYHHRIIFCTFYLKIIFLPLFFT